MEELNESKLIYIDDNFQCHIDQNGERIPFLTSFFNGREDLIESYYAIPEGKIWTRFDGVVFQGEMLFPMNK